MTNCCELPEAPAQAATELLRRRAARARLIDFTQFTFPGYMPDPAHMLIADHLDAVVRGDIRRLMIFMGPQHGKSELTSVRLPAYWLGRRPNDPIILCSYAASLAESKSRQARQIVESPEFQQLFPNVETQRDSRAVNHWKLAGQRGGMLAAGAGGPITGHGGLLGVIDDPVENWEAAQSEVLREKAWEWYRSTFRTRIWEHGAIVLIQTRWHASDLAGRLLQDQGSEWTVLRLPAVAETQEDRDINNKLLGLPTGQRDPLDREPGAPLCPSRFSLSALQALKRDVGSQAWGGQYQGVPRPPEGNRFKRGWFTIVDASPFQASRVRYWDRAASDGHGDFTVGVLLAFVDGIFFIEDMVRGQWSPGQRDAVMKQTADRDALRHNNTVQVWVEEEPGSGGKESALSAIRLLAGHPVRPDKVTGDKEVRAEPLAAQAEAGNVRLVRGAWNGDWLDEVCGFPTAAHDDAVDATSGAFNKLAGRRQIQPLRTYTLNGRAKLLRLVVCNREELAGLTLDVPCLLVSIADPIGEPALPPHGLDKLLSSVVLAFADLAPEECHASWNEPIARYDGRRAEQVICTAEHGKKLWSLLKKRRDPCAEVIVIQDDGDRRAMSVAYAITDTQGLPRAESICRPSEIEWKATRDDKAPNAHVCTIVKTSQGMVMGQLVTKFGGRDTTRWSPLRV